MRLLGECDTPVACKECIKPRTSRIPTPHLLASSSLNEIQGSQKIPGDIKLVTLGGIFAINLQQSSKNRKYIRSSIISLVHLFLKYKIISGLD
jgi:hypothetical protein